MKGMATVRLLRELERHTGKPVSELFDLIGARGGGRGGGSEPARMGCCCWPQQQPLPPTHPPATEPLPAVGTSTGGLLAVALGLRRMSMDECEDIYKVCVCVCVGGGGCVCWWRGRRSWAASNAPSRR